MAGRGEMLLKNSHASTDSPVQLSMEDKLLAIIQEKDAIIREQAEEIGRIRERMSHLERMLEKNASGAATSTIAGVG